MPKPSRRAPNAQPAGRPPAWPCASRVGEVRTRASSVLVVRGRRACGVVAAELLVRARQFGLAHLTLEELLAGAAARRPAQRAPDAARVVELLERHAGAEALELLREIGRTAAARGWPVALVGGVVRDLLLGRACGDVDLVVEGPAGELADLVAAERGGQVLRFRDFGTAALLLPDGRRVDFAMARRETYDAPAALPRVRAASMDEDAWRRDFTVNALRVVLDPPAFGRLIDDVGGIDDLRRGRLRLLHGLSLIDDPTRAFRAARFAARLGFKPTPETERLVRVARRERVFERLSATRLRREVERLLADDGPRAVRALARLGLLAEIDPALRDDGALRRRIRRAAGALERYRAGAGRTPVVGWAVQLAVAALGLAPAARRRLVARLRPARGPAEWVERGPLRIERLLAECAEAGVVPRPGGLHARCRGVPTELLLVAAAAAEPRLGRAIERYASRRADVRLDISGRDLVRAGVPPGPRVAAGLDTAWRARLDGRAKRRADQLALALRAARRA